MSRNKQSRPDYAPLPKGHDLVTTLKELSALGVAFVSLTEALDLTTPTGRAMAGLLSVCVFRAM
ncbi:MAG TPA: recombinase family protein [Candidatus Acidoferrum sp.]|nr:recombinase family protein [Candidatus Acidoferrum sp.]